MLTAGQEHIARKKVLWALVGLGVLLTVVNTITILSRPPVEFVTTDIKYTHYNNYLIFVGSGDHLLEGKNLYSSHVPEHHDYFKYSPTFALGMIPFKYMPLWLGLSLWNLLNLLAVLIPLALLARQNNWKIWVVPLLMIVFEGVTSIQSSQSNGLLIGSILGAWLCLEKDKPLWAMLLIMLGAFIKIYSLVGLVMFLFKPKRWESASWGLLWGVLLFLLPALAVGWGELFWQYKNWYGMLAHDYNASVGMSILGILDSWFGLEQAKYPLLGVGVVMLFLPFLFNKDFKHNGFRMHYLAFVLLWVVLFNHKAESPTYILAVAGVVLWFVNNDNKLLDWILLVLVFAFTVLASTDVYPESFRHDFLEPYHIKAFPCLLVMLRIFQGFFSQDQKEVQGSIS